MVWRLTMIDSGGLLSGLNAGQIGTMQKLPDDRRLMMQQPVSHASLLRQHRLRAWMAWWSPTRFAAVNKAV